MIFHCYIQLYVIDITRCFCISSRDHDVTKVLCTTLFTTFCVLWNFVNIQGFCIEHVWYVSYHSYVLRKGNRNLCALLCLLMLCWSKPLIIFRHKCEKCKDCLQYCGAIWRIFHSTESVLKYHLTCHRPYHSTGSRINIPLKFLHEWKMFLMTMY